MLARMKPAKRVDNRDSIRQSPQGKEDKRLALAAVEVLHCGGDYFAMHQPS
jgi:hypothetical protein